LRRPGKRCAGWRNSQRKNGKHFSFVEIGYTKRARAAAEPWGFKTGGEHASEIQQHCIDTALDLPARHPFLAGMFWWKWFPEIPHHHEENYRLQPSRTSLGSRRLWNGAGPPSGR